MVSLDIPEILVFLATVVFRVTQVSLDTRVTQVLAATQETLDYQVIQDLAVIQESPAIQVTPE